MLKMGWKILGEIAAGLEVSELIEYIRGALDYSKEKHLKLDGIYDNWEGCEAGRVQGEICLSTRSLDSRFCAMSVWNASDVQQKDLETALEVLEEARNMFNNHPFSQVLYGRQVYIATEAKKAGLEMPARFASYSGRKLKSWQNPCLNYASPANVKKERDRLPPEWRT